MAHRRLLRSGMNDFEVIGTATVGKRGQVVIPAPARKLIGVRAGDRMVVLVKAGGIAFVPVRAFRQLIARLAKHLGGMKL